MRSDDPVEIDNQPGVATRTGNEAYMDGRGVEIDDNMGIRLVNNEDET